MEQILRRKAAQGVDVRLIYDDFGSLLGLPSDFVIRMEKAHIRCIPFNPVVPLVSLVMNHRDHRKIVVVDGNVAYTGGVNLADEYINAEQRFGYWKDAAIRLEGAAVWNFTVMFLNVWNAFRPQETDYTAFAPTRLPAVQDGVVQPYADSRWMRNRWPRRSTWTSSLRPRDMFISIRPTWPWARRCWML